VLGWATPARPTCWFDSGVYNQVTPLAVGPLRDEGAPLDGSYAFSVNDLVAVVCHLVLVVEQYKDHLRTYHECYYDPEVRG
jgi:hypothetical protein